MDGTIIQQGFFTSAGANVTLNIPSGTDWIQLINFTQIAANAAATGYEFQWQLGMPNGIGIETQSNGAANAVNLIPTAANSFVLVDTSANPNGASIAVTGSSNAVRPIVTTGNTTGLTAGSVVRLLSVANVPNLSGYDFTIDTIVPGVSFRIANPLANAPGAVGGAGFYRQIKFDPIFYPTHRSIVNITQAAQAVVTTSVDHGYTVGQELRMHVPAAFGMIEMDGLAVDVVAVTAGTFTINVDSTGFTAFAFPLPAAVPFTPALVVPLGEQANATASDPNLLNDATVNTAFIGIQLAAGVDGPAGQLNDVIFWKVGKSFNT
jgi:hypothetical protein